MTGRSFMSAAADDEVIPDITPQISFGSNCRMSSSTTATYPARQIASLQFLTQAQHPSHRFPPLLLAQSTEHQ